MNAHSDYFQFLARELGDPSSPLANPSPADVGTAIGAATGYAVTRHSSGSFRGLGTIVGGAAGGAIGNGISNRPRVHQGVQIFVQTTNSSGRPNPNLTSVVQDDDQRIRVGQDVLLIRSRDGLSVAPVDAGVAP